MKTHANPSRHSEEQASSDTARILEAIALMIIYVALFFYFWTVLG